jgi:hypothetical protein
MSVMPKVRLVVARSLGLWGLVVWADGAESGRRGEAQLAPAGREMNTDRPDATESPFTLEPGRVQLEMDFANYGREEGGGEKTTGWEAAPLNLRFGITPDFEAGFFVVPFRRQTHQPAGGARTSRSGAGDVTLRGKWNFFGNGDGTTGWGAIADLKLPTAARGLGNGKVEGALTLPVAFSFTRDWSGAAMTSLETVYGDRGTYRAAWTNTLTAGRNLTANVGVFVELASTTGDGAHVATFNFGFTRTVGPDLQFDAGANLGLSEAATDLVLFAGMARRF